MDDDALVEVPPPGTDPRPAPLFGDIDWLFDVVESIPPAYLREVVFDPTLGYPTLVVAVGPFHQEWTARVEDLQPTADDPPAVPAAAASLPWMSRGRMQHVRTIVAGTVGGVLAPSFDDPGWIVEFHPESTPGGGLRILDPLPVAGLPLVWGHQGESLILFLAEETPRLGEDPTPTAEFSIVWAARRTDQGLEFVGPADAAPFLNTEVPRLCVPAADRTASAPPTLLGADDQLAVLTEWLHRLRTFQANHGTAATSAQAEARLARICRDLGLAH